MSTNFSDYTGARNKDGSPDKRSVEGKAYMAKLQSPTSGRTGAVNKPLYQPVQALTNQLKEISIGSSNPAQPPIMPRNVTHESKAGRINIGMSPAIPRNVTSESTTIISAAHPKPSERINIGPSPVVRRDITSEVTVVTSTAGAKPPLAVKTAQLEEVESLWNPLSPKKFSGGIKIFNYSSRDVFFLYASGKNSLQTIKSSFGVGASMSGEVKLNCDTEKARKEIVTYSIQGIVAGGHTQLKMHDKEGNLTILYLSSQEKDVMRICKTIPVVREKTCVNILDDTIKLPFDTLDYATWTTITKSAAY